MHTPLWIRLCRKLPLRLQHRIRQMAVQAEYQSVGLVLEDSTRLLSLIENTESPDFEAFERELQAARDRWMLHDSEFAALAARKRFLVITQSKGV